MDGECQLVAVWAAALDGTVDSWVASQGRVCNVSRYMCTMGDKVVPSVCVYTRYESVHLVGGVCSQPVEARRDVEGKGDDDCAAGWIE